MIYEFIIIYIQKGHIDRGLLDVDVMSALCDRGAVVEFDNFAWGCSMNHVLSYGITFPSDFDRCQMIVDLVRRGYGDKVTCI